jgi:hypothetical protein
MVHAHAGVGVLLSNLERSFVVFYGFLRSCVVSRRHCIEYEKEEGEIVIVIRN